MTLPADICAARGTGLDGRVDSRVLAQRAMMVLTYLPAPSGRMAAPDLVHDQHPISTRFTGAANAGYSSKRR